MPTMVSTNSEIIQSIPNLLKTFNGISVQHEMDMTKKNMDEKDEDNSVHNKSDTKNEKKLKKKKKKFTCKQKLALMSMALVDFMSFCAMSIMAPFFPQEADSKGMSETVSGFVFSFYALVMFLSSPVFGKILPRTGEKVLFIGGILLSGVCGVLFGTLQYVEDNFWFTFLSFFIRGLEALGASSYSTASYVYVVNIFPEHVGTVRGTLETFVGLGMSAGPAIGGFLFSFGGFGLPFYVIGALTIASAPMNLCFLPPSEDNHLKNKSGSMTQLCKIPAVMVTASVIVMTSITWGFLDPTLEPHLRQFKLSPEMVGLLFLLLSATYGISSPGWGWLSDRLHHHWSLMAIGLFFSAIGLLLLGPSPIFPFLESSVTIDVIALSIIGLSVAMALLPTFDGVLIFALAGGCEESLATQGVVAGLWSASYSLGEVIGPSVGGVLLQYHGFPIAATAMAVMNLVLVIVCIIYFPSKKRKADEKMRKAKENEQKIIENVRYFEMSTGSNMQNTISDDQKLTLTNGIKIEQLENGDSYKKISNEIINFIDNDAICKDDVERGKSIESGTNSVDKVKENISQVNIAVISVTKQIDKCEEKNKRTKL